MSLHLLIHNYNNDTNLLPNLYNLSANSMHDGSTLFETKNSLVCGEWYDDLISWIKEHNGVTYPEIYQAFWASNIKATANCDIPNGTSFYMLPKIQLWKANNKNLDGITLVSTLYDGGRENNGYGATITFKGMAYKLSENNTEDQYYLITFGFSNNSQQVYDPPLFFYNGYAKSISLLQANKITERYDSNIQLSSITPQTDVKLNVTQPTAEETYLKITKNGKEIGTLDLNKKGNQLDVGSVGFNDVINMTKTAKPTGEPSQPAQPAQPAQPVEPKYYNLPKIEHVTFNPTKVEFGKNTTVNVTVEDGYKINMLTFECDNQNTGLPIFKTEYKDGTIIFDLTKIDSTKADYIIKNMYTPNDVGLAVRYAKLDNKLAHGKLYQLNSNTSLYDIEVTKFDLDKTYDLQVKANGYSFSNISLTGGVYDDPIGTVTGDKIKIVPSDFSTEGITDGDTLTLDGTETQIQTIQYANIKSDEPNPNYTINYQKVEVGKSYNIIITAKDNYEFYVKNGSSLADKAYIILNKTQRPLLISSDRKTLSYSQPITISNTNDIIVHADTLKIKLDDSDRTKIPIELNLTHCKANITYLLSMGDGILNGEHDVKTTTITLTADIGYIFDKNVTYYNYAPELGRYVSNTAKATHTGTISFDMCAGSASDYNKNVQGEHPSITAVASAEQQPITTGLDSIHLYNMRNGELDNLSNQLIDYQKSSGDVDTYDYTNFINQIYRLPFAIPSSIQTTVTKVACGLVNLSVETHKLTKESYDIDVGTIDCTGVNKNSIDYNTLQCTLILPFIPSINLSINDIVDNKLTITYRINLLNGMCTLVINNDTGNIYTSNISVATNLQIYGSYEDKDVGSLHSVLNNQIRQAYLIISSNTPIDNLECYPCSDHGKLKDYHGLTKTSNTKLNFATTLTERNDIINQLENGVYIK